jgi:hypothetical protein
MSADDFLRRYKGDLSSKTPYERRYVEKVLAHVDGLDWDAVSPQTTFVDREGRRRRIDFTIIEGEWVRIAIEVDGFDKTGRGSGMTRTEFADWSRREQEINEQGYRVIRVANSLIDREPDRCRRCVDLTLKQQRRVAEMIAEAGREIGDAERAQLEREALTPGENQELEEILSSQAKSIEQLRAQLGEEVDRRQAAEGARRKAVRLAGGLVAALALVVIAAVTVVAVTSGGSAESLGKTAADGSAAKPLCAKAKTWKKASGLIGQRAVLRGRVVEASFKESSSGSPTFLTIGNAFPDPQRLEVVIWGRNRDRFDPGPEDQFADSVMAVAGEVGEYRGTPQIELRSPNAAAVCS